MLYIERFMLDKIFKQKFRYTLENYLSTIIDQHPIKFYDITFIKEFLVLEDDKFYKMYLYFFKFYLKCKSVHIEASRQNNVIMQLVFLM
jgi:hypothetical protein